MRRTVKVWWHCLWRVVASPSHRMVRLGGRAFCQCGYPEMPELVMRWYLRSIRETPIQTLVARLHAEVPELSPPAASHSTEGAP
jgi:hypothetical protein